MKKNMLLMIVIIIVLALTACSRTGTDELRSEYAETVTSSVQRYCYCSSQIFAMSGNSDLFCGIIQSAKYML